MRDTVGREFMEVECGYHLPSVSDLDEAVANRDLKPLPTFSEQFLTPRVGRSDAQLILGVVDEYEELIARLGEELVRRLLEGNPDYVTEVQARLNAVEYRELQGERS